MATKQKDVALRRIQVVHILIKFLLDPKDIKSLRVDFEDLVIQEVITEVESKKIRETFRDLITDLEDTFPTTEEENIKINTLIAQLSKDDINTLVRITNKTPNYQSLVEIREFFSRRSEKIPLSDCKSVINYFRQHNLS